MPKMHNRSIRVLSLAVAAIALACTAGASDRKAAWDEDLAVARDVFLSKDRSYSTAARLAAREEIERARSNIERWTDQQIVASLARAAALSGNAHTRAYLLRNRSYWRRYPLRIWRFPEGWYVVAARGEATPLLGGRITHIQGLPVEMVFQAVRPLFAGNAGWAMYMGTYTLTSPDALLGVAVLAGDGVGEFSVERSGKQLSVRLAPEPLDPRTVPEESWWFLSPQHPATAGWLHVLANRELPPVLIEPARYYSFERCADDVLYVRYNRSANEPGQETVRSFGERLIVDITTRAPRKLVLDLRFNTGGDLSQARSLMELLSASPLGRETGRIAVIVGPSTFSAGITPAAWLRARSRAVLVGAHPGDEPDFWAEGGNVVLPNSRIAMHFADGLHQYSDAPVPPGTTEHLQLGIDVAHLEPDTPANWSWQDYLSGRDPIAKAAAGGELRCGGTE